jgi:hypothetical protein
MLPFQEAILSTIISATPLAFELVCKEKTLATMGDAIRFVAELAPEQRDQYCWKVAMLSIHSATREPAYIKAATINLQTALNLNGLLARPPEFP